MDKNKVIESAAKLVAKGQLDKAAKEFQRALDVEPDDVRILQKLAELYQKMGKKDLAADCFEKVAKTYAAQGFYLKAVALYKQVLKVVERIEVNIRLAELYQQLGLIGDATKEWQNVASYYEKIGDLKSSLDTLKKLVDLDPDNVAARIRLGEQYARQENLVEAVSELRRAAAYLQRNSRQDDYLRVAERISHLDPGDATLARELAESYMSRGDAKRALAKLQICFKANPRDLQTLQMLARAFQDLGQVSKTVSVLKELARVHVDAARLDEAARTYQQAAELAPDDADIKASLAQIEDELKTGVKKAPSSPGSRSPSSPGMRSGAGRNAAVLRSMPGKAPPAAVPQSVPRPPTAPIAAPTRPVSRIPTPPPSAPLSSAQGPSGARSVPPPPPPVSSPGTGPLPSMSSVPKLLKETEVYVKYGLHEKALDHLSKVFALDPDNTEALEKAKTLALAMKRPGEASDALAKLVRLYSARSDPRADTAKAELRELDPAHPALRLPAKLGAAFGDDDDDKTSLDLPRETPANARDATQSPNAGRPPPPPPPSSPGVAEEVPFINAALEAADISGELPMPIERPPEANQAPPAHEENPARAASPSSAGAAAGSSVVHNEVSPEPAQEEPRDEALSVVVDESLEGAVVEQADDPFEPASGQAASEEDHFASDLAEADFYIDAGLAEDARAILEGILLAAPDHPGALSRLDALTSPSGPPPEGGDGLADAGTHGAEADALAAELAAELASEVAELALTEVDDGPLDSSPGMEHLVSKPIEPAPNSAAAKMQEAVQSEDAQTHYDLGIAYKEMGLLDEAIAELQLALQVGGGTRKIDCITVLGSCAIEQGRPEEAVSVLSRALGEPDLAPAAQRALGYELGQAYEALGERALALAQYAGVERSERGFRDTQARIQRLGGTISVPVSKPKTGPITSSNAPPARAPAAPQKATTPPAPPAVLSPPPSPPQDAPASSAPASSPQNPTPETPEETPQRRNRKIGFI